MTLLGVRRVVHRLRKNSPLVLEPGQRVRLIIVAPLSRKRFCVVTTWVALVSVKRCFALVLLYSRTIPCVVGCLAFSIKGWCTVCIMSLIKVLRLRMAPPILVVRFLKSLRRLVAILVAFPVSRLLVLTLCSTRWSLLRVDRIVLLPASSRVPRPPSRVLSRPRPLSRVVPRLGMVEALDPRGPVLGRVALLKCGSFFVLNILPTRPL